MTDTQMTQKLNLQSGVWPDYSTDREMLKAFSVCLIPGGLGLGKQEWAHTLACTSAFQGFKLTHRKDPWSRQSQRLGVAFVLGFFLPQGTFRQFQELRGPLSSSQKLLRMDLGLRVSTDGLAARPEHSGEVRTCVSLGLAHR